MLEQGHFSCMLCDRNFSIKRVYYAHFSLCVEEISEKITQLEEAVGSCRQTDDLNFRLELYISQPQAASTPIKLQ